MKNRIRCRIRQRIRYEDENIRCVVHNIRCRIRFVTYDIVCATCDIVCYIRCRTSDIRYRKLRYRMSRGYDVVYRYRMSGRAISYMYDIARHITIIRYRMSDIQYRMLARIQMKQVRTAINKLRQRGDLLLSKVICGLDARFPFM